jgi:hypothetical protein
MPHKLLPIGTLLIATLLQGCGGGGGGNGVTQTTNFPLRTGMMNVYGMAWQKSGTVSGTDSSLCVNPPPGTGGRCSSPITGTFTNTVTPGGTITLGGVSANQISVSRVVVTNLLGGSTVSYQLGVKSDFSAVVDASGCVLPIPEIVSIGYTSVLSCPNGTSSNAVTLSVTADNSSGQALVAVTSAYGKEIYGLSPNGSVTPISIGPISGTRNNGYASYFYSLIY